MSWFELKEAKISIILLPVFLFAKNIGKCAFTEWKKARKANLSGLFPFPVGSKCSISKHVSAATKAMNNIMAYENNK